MLDDRRSYEPRRRGPDPLPALLFVAHLAHGLAFSRLYPEHRYDPDILSYLVYFRSWMEGAATLHGAAYFNQPKPLLVFGLGALGDVDLAFHCTAVVSALLGSLVYLVGRSAFGRATGVLWSVMLLADPQKCFLTLKSSADLYLTTLLFATLWFSLAGRLAGAAFCLLLSALVKPVTIPCAAHFLVLDGAARKRWACALVVLLALPLTLLANRLLLGSAVNPLHYLGEFASLRDGESIGPSTLVHFVLWTQLVKTRFVSTAPLGILGLVLWLGRDRRRLRSPLLLVPLLFLSGYLMLAALTPYMPFFRFFWFLEVWFLGFLVYAIVEIARRLASGRIWAQVAAAAVLLLFVADDSVVKHLQYREHFALPMETNQAFVDASRQLLQRQRTAGERLLVPLAFQPYLMWALNTSDAAGIASAEQRALRGGGEHPAWVLHVPSGYISQGAREYVAALIQEGHYEVRLTDGKAALLALAMAGNSDHASARDRGATLLGSVEGSRSAENHAAAADVELRD